MIDPATIQTAAGVGQTAIAGGIAGIVLSSTAKAVLDLVISRLLKQAGILSDGIKEDFKIMGQEVSVIYPKSVQQINLFFNIDRRFSNRKKVFKGNVLEVSLKSVNPYEDFTSKAILMRDDGFEILYKYLDPDRTYWLQTDYYIKYIEKLMQDWVDREVAHEAPKGVDEIYWLHAQIREYDQFCKIFNKFELIDMDFNVKVMIDNHVKTSIPKYYEEEMITIRQWVRSRDREEKSKLTHKHLQQQGRKT